MPVQQPTRILPSHPKMLPTVSITVLPRTALPPPQAPVANQRITLLLFWVVCILTSYILQVRSLVNLVIPHKISSNLAAQSLEGVTTNVTNGCPVRGLRIANIWWDLVPTHYYPKAIGNVCHFVIPQYNIHGNYYIGEAIAHPQRIQCVKEVRTIEFYFYHGSLGYVAYYVEGKGELCTHDMQADMKVGQRGSVDLNGKALAMDKTDENSRTSVWFLIFGVVWLGFRALVLRRSFILYKRYIDRRLGHGDHIHTQDAIVYIQESARLTAHDATNWQRCVIVYMLAEGLMADMFEMVTTEGFRGLVQGISLGYNFSSILSVLFEIVKSRFRVTRLLRVLNRVLLNHESTIIGEFACAFAIRLIVTITNKSKMSETRLEAEAVSYYVWGLVGHFVAVSMFTILLLTVRTIGSISLVLWTYRSLSVLSAPCTIDDVMGVRQRLSIVNGYRMRNDQLYYSRRMLRMYGLMQTVSEDDHLTYLVQEKVCWFATPRHGFVAIGVINGTRVERCTPMPIRGYVALCEHVLGGFINQLSIAVHEPITRSRRTVMPTSKLVDC